MKGTSFTRLFSLASIPFVTFALLFSGQAYASLIYSEDFITGGDTSVATFGWSAYEDDGTDLTSSTTDPMRVLSSDYVFIGSSGSNVGGAYALISAAPSIDPTAYQNDLTISFNQTANDRDTSDVGTMGWRVLVRVGSTWYATDLLSFSPSIETRSAVVSDSIWRSWETDLTDGFLFADGNFGAPAALPGGTISSFGILAVDGVTIENDSLALRSFEITGTVPEPSTVSVLLALVLATGCFGRRRRQRGSGING